jgi:hypothetical protein
MTSDPDNLPDDPVALREMLLRTQETLLNTQQVLLGTMAQLDATRQQLAAKEHQLQRVRHWLEQLLRHRYGQKRERVDENQLFLFAVELASTGREAPPEPPEVKPASGAPRPAPQGHGRQRLPQSLERRRVVFDLTAEERRCPECHSELKHIGEEISERLEYVPASLHVIEEACQK